MDIRIRYLGLAGAGFCALLLGGCATNFHEAGLGQIDGVQPNQGLVVLRSETNATRVYQNTFLKWDDVYMEADSDAPVSPKDDDRQFYGIPDLLDQMASSETFVGALPAGSYRIVTFSSSVDTGNAHVFLAAHPDVILGSFTVTAGKVSDLGTIIFQPNIDKPDGRYLFSHIQSDMPLAPLIGSYFPGKSSGFDLDRPESGWAPNPFQAANDSINVEELKNTPPNGAFYFAADGSVYIPSTLGQILVRSPQGSWRAVDTGHRSDLYCLLHTKDGKYLASGDDGALLEASTIDGPWILLYRFDPGANVAYIAQASDGALYVVLGKPVEVLKPGTQGHSSSQVTLDISLEKSLDGGKGPWKRVADSTITPGADFVYYTGNQLKIKVAGAGNFIVVLNAERSLFYYSLGADTWEQSDSGLGNEVTPLSTGDFLSYPSNGGATNSMGGVINGMLFLNQNHGKTTQKLEKLQYVRSAAEVDGGWVALGKPRSLDPYKNIQYGQEGMYFSPDGAVTWKYLAPLPDGCLTFAPLQAHGQNVWLPCWDGRIFGIKLGDSTWRLDRNIELAK